MNIWLKENDLSEVSHGGWGKIRPGNSSFIICDKLYGGGYLLSPVWNILFWLQWKLQPVLLPLAAKSKTCFQLLGIKLSMCETQLLGLMLNEWILDLIYHLFVSCVHPRISQAFLFNYSRIGTWLALAPSSGYLADRIVQRSNI